MDGTWGLAWDVSGPNLPLTPTPHPLPRATAPPHHTTQQPHLDPHPSLRPTISIPTAHLMPCPLPSPPPTSPGLLDWMLLGPLCSGRPTGSSEVAPGVDRPREVQPWGSRGVSEARPPPHPTPSHPSGNPVRNLGLPTLNMHTRRVPDPPSLSQIGPPPSLSGSGMPKVSVSYVMEGFRGLRGGRRGSVREGFGAGVSEDDVAREACASGTRGERGKSTRQFRRHARVQVEPQGMQARP